MCIINAQIYRNVASIAYSKLPRRDRRAAAFSLSVHFVTVTKKGRSSAGQTFASLVRLLWQNLNVPVPVPPQPISDFKYTANLYLCTVSKLLKCCEVTG